MSRPDPTFEELRDELRANVRGLQISTDFLDAGFTDSQLQALAMLLSASTEAVIEGVARTIVDNNARLRAAE